MNQDRTFATTLRESRERYGLSQRALAEKLQSLGVSVDQTAIARMESGKREPKLTEAAQIATYLGFDLGGVEIPNEDTLSMHGYFDQIQGLYYETRLAIRDYLGVVAFAIGTYRPDLGAEHEEGWRNADEFKETLLGFVKRLPGKEADNEAKAVDWSKFDFLPAATLGEFVEALTFDLRDAIEDDPKT